MVSDGDVWGAVRGEMQRTPSAVTSMLSFLMVTFLWWDKF